MITRPSLTPLADLGRSAWQAPLHRLHAAGIATADDDAEFGARLVEGVRSTWALLAAASTSCVRAFNSSDHQ
jgi:hypothetical protein